MLIRGQLVLNINLKKKAEVHQAMSLLETILAESLPVFTGSDIAKIRSELKAGTFTIRDPTVIKPIPIPKTIAEKEAFLKKHDSAGYKKYYNETYGTTQAEKERENIYKFNDVHVDKNTGEISVTPKVRNTPDWKKIDADIKKNKAKQKQRAAALKRKRDKSGHFLPGKVSK
jgi:hypothetical protein